MDGQDDSMQATINNGVPGVGPVPPQQFHQQGPRFILPATPDPVLMQLVTVMQQQQQQLAQQIQEQHQQMRQQQQNMAQQQESITAIVRQQQQFMETVAANNGLRSAINILLEPTRSHCLRHFTSCLTPATTTWGTNNYHDQPSARAFEETLGHSSLVSFQHQHAGQAACAIYNHVVVDDHLFTCGGHREAFGRSRARVSTAGPTGLVVNIWAVIDITRSPPKAVDKRRAAPAT
ncbi:conserved hypothetical protein [Culex quinquefasciatus]|uniref:Uncharacterized protein n=1 Tax=Culex quinquefasciatus TaxID=7176 RepID=B0XKU3_CULQU|nr:conserved hypothetical protein [Culex quinquefasciatus]|eukprot:XP_001870265.1 conserved hypothetical protein [Culex quinquefasciatus]